MRQKIDNSTSYLMLCHHRCKHVDQLRLQFTYQHLYFEMFTSQCRQEASKLALAFSSAEWLLIKKSCNIVAKVVGRYSALN